MPTRKIAPLEGYRMIDALVEAGVVPPGSTKVIIEISAPGMVEIHYSAVGEENLLGVLPGVFKPPTIGNATHDGEVRAYIDREGNEVP